MLAGWYSAIPFRYRGYVYDQETGFYYLNSRYYDPAMHRFLNADGLISTGQGLLGNNMYAYCNNNPVMYSDLNGQSGTAAVAATLATALKIVAIVAVVVLVIAIVTDPDFQEGASDFVDTARNVVSDFVERIKSKVESKEKNISISDTENANNQAYFTVDPYAFNPNGLVRYEYSGTKNGRVIKWVDPSTNVAVFEWNEDLNKGSHYHILDDGKHTGDHWLPNQAVPEPWNSIYFGG